LNYLLDTNAVIAVLKHEPIAVRTRLRRALARGGTIGISAIVLFELWYGVARSTRQRENTDRLHAFLAGAIEIVPFADEDAVAAGELRAALEAAGAPIGPYDLLIAAQAVRTGATLITANVAEFARVRGLSWQDWSVAR
jgi:tRNA(fMet)-specific endonuclease VapC